MIEKLLMNRDIKSKNRRYTMGAYRRQYGIKMELKLKLPRIQHH